MDRYPDGALGLNMSKSDSSKWSFVIVAVKDVWDKVNALVSVDWPGNGLLLMRGRRPSMQRDQLCKCIRVEDPLGKLRVGKR